MRVAAWMLAVAAAWGQGGVEGVRSGVVFDAPTASLRVVEGVPGAAHLGAAVAGGVEAAWVSPTGQAALLRQGGAWLAIKGLGTEETETRELGVEAEAVRWDAGGRFAAVRTAAELRVWDAEAMEWALRLDLGEGREAADVAVNENGALHVAWYDGETTALEVWRDGSWQELGRVRGRGRAACAGVVTALAGESEIVVFGEAGEAWRGSTERMDAPAAVAVQQGDIVAAYGGEKPELVWWKAGGGEARRVELESTPERAEPLAGSNGLLLKQRAREGDEIWVAVRRGGVWAVFFVPAGE
ncbi:MAG: hypothetical protein KatS3mg004_0280 [Bryobacteraceae bacterium]|nr:MAG: hypothetical protein KatS3mg004_0280 [Bryobacteraceae bacterium]